MSGSYESEEDQSTNSLALLYQDLRSHDEIRFASYRTASKLRYIQKKTYLHHIDIWNMIEAFRENGFNSIDSSTLVNQARLETLISTLYTSLQKRLPPGQNVGVDRMAEMLLNWLVSAVLRAGDRDRLKVRTIKMVLATLCAGKLMDKLRYVFSQRADSNGHLIHQKFNQFMKDILKIPAAVGEYQNFSSKHRDMQEVIFDEQSKITVNEFLETMMSDPGPQCLSWLLVLHRILNAEAIHHPVSCGSCQSQGFNGLRYKSDRANYHLCQSCFWRGKIGPDHKDDVFKEYNSYKPSGRASFKRSLQCIPQEKAGRSPGGKGTSSLSHLPHFEQEKPYDLSHIVPSSPLASHNGFDRSTRFGSAMSTNSAPNRFITTPERGDHMMKQLTSTPRPLPANGPTTDDTSADEHTLIVEYASKLTSNGKPGGQRPDEGGRRALRHSKQIVQELERKNQEIMRDIERLRRSHRDEQAASLQLARSGNPKLIEELHGLRNHKQELEDRLLELQETRKDLMNELEELMKLLRMQKDEPDPTLNIQMYNECGEV